MTVGGQDRCHEQRRQQVADGHRLIWSSRNATPSQQQAPGRGQRHEVGFGEHVTGHRARDVREPCTTPTTNADAATPQPNDRRERDRGEAVQGRLEDELVRAVAETVGQRPEIVSGPMQNSSEAATKPSMNRRRSSEPSALVEPSLQPAPEPLEPVLDAQQRPGDAADEQRPEHDQHRSGVADGVAEDRIGDREGRQCRDEQGDQAERIGDDVTRALRQPVADQDADAGPDEHRATLTTVPNPRNTCV